MNTRTKYRNQYSTVFAPSSWESLVPTPGPKSGTLESRLLQVSENMIDGRKAKRSYNSCRHGYGKLLSIATATSPHRYETGPTYWTSADCGSQFCHLSGNVALRRAEEATGSGADQLDERLIAYYMQKLVKKPPVVLSLPNFLWELREFKRMFNVWGTRFGFLHNIAHLRLGYEYGWKLFLQDIVKIINSIKTLHKRVKRFLDGMGTVKHNRYRVRLLDQDRGLVTDNGIGCQESFLELNNSSFASFSGFYDYSWQATEHYEVANIRYSYFAPELSAFSAQLGYLLHAFGVEWNPRIIWDAIPYTFVIDWFLSVGDFIEDWLAHPLVPVHARVHDFSITRKCIVDAKVEYRWLVDIVPTPVWAYNTVLYRGRSYVRVADIHPKPTVPDLINAGFSKIGRSRFLNGAALIVARSQIPASKLPRRVPHPRGKKILGNKKNPNPLTNERREPQVKFTWPDRPWAPKYSNEFLADFKLYNNAPKTKRYIVDSEPRHNTAWAVKFKRDIDETFLKSSYIR